jgi:hypothetical protein
MILRLHGIDTCSFKHATVTVLKDTAHGFQNNI